MNAFLGYVLAQIICYGEYNCHAEPISEKIYASKSDCEWDRQMVSSSYKRVECIEVSRSDEKQLDF